MTRVLTQDDHRHIAAAISAAEAKTSGEIYCVVSHAVASYRWIPVTLGAVAVLLTPVLIGLLAPGLLHVSLFGADWSSGNFSQADMASSLRRGLLTVSLIQIAVFAVVTALSWPQRVRLWFAPPPMRLHKVMLAARSQFLAQGLQQTADRTGLLLFIAMAERQAVLIADDGIDAKVEQQVWDDTIAGLTEAAAAGRLAEGLVTAIGQCGNLLAQHFPPESQPRNQLPNRVVEL